MPTSIGRSSLYSVDGVAIYKERVIIPASLRGDCLQYLHSAHQGTTMMQSKANAFVFWPGIAADIANHRASCNTMSPSQASMPPTPPVLPSRAFARTIFITRATLTWSSSTASPAGPSWNACHWPSVQPSLHLCYFRHPG